MTDPLDLAAIRFAGLDIYCSEHHCRAVASPERTRLVGIHSEAKGFVAAWKAFCALLRWELRATWKDLTEVRPLDPVIIENRAVIVHPIHYHLLRQEFSDA